jgi:hypothetical protein
MKNKSLIIITVSIIATGCMNGPNPPPASGGGLNVEKFSLVDTDLNPNQTTQLELEMTYSDTSPINLSSEDISLFNLGKLNASNKECTPEEMERRQGDYVPKMNCNWLIEAPPAGTVEPFEKKPISINLVMEYERELNNKKPVKLNFQEIEDIDETRTISETFSNQEVQMKIDAETPLQVEKTNTIEVKLKKKGGGELLSNYSVRYRPKKIFKECPSELEPIDGEISRNCNVKSLITGTRNLYFSTSYKYERILNELGTVNAK